MKDTWRPDIVAVMEHYGSRILMGRGDWSKATCPLNEHDDKSPSASVNVEAGKWVCWSCDQRGDGLDIIGRNEGIVGWADCLEYAKAHFPGSGGDVRPERGPGGRLLGKPRTVKRGKPWSPPWNLR